MNIHIISQQYWGFNQGDVGCGKTFINIHTLSQCNESIYFRDMDGVFENGDVSGVNAHTNIHTLYQQSGLISLINSNSSEGIEMNDELMNGDMSSGTGLINTHTLSKFNESSYFNDMYCNVENGNVSGGNYFMIFHTLY